MKKLLLALGAVALLASTGSAEGARAGSDGVMALADLSGPGGPAASAQVQAAPKAFRGPKLNASRRFGGSFNGRRLGSADSGSGGAAPTTSPDLPSVLVPGQLIRTAGLGALTSKPDAEPSTFAVEAGPKIGYDESKGYALTTHKGVFEGPKDTPPTANPGTGGSGKAGGSGITENKGYGGVGTSPINQPATATNSNANTTAPSGLRNSDGSSGTGSSSNNSTGGQ